MENSIRPSSDLRNHYAEISRLCREKRQPVHITVNGRGDTVLMSEADYANMRKELELLRMLSLSEEDEAQGRIASAGATFEALREQLKGMAQP